VRYELTLGAMDNPCIFWHFSDGESRSAEVPPGLHVYEGSHRAGLYDEWLRRPAVIPGRDIRVHPGYQRRNGRGILPQHAGHVPTSQVGYILSHPPSILVSLPTTTGIFRGWCDILPSTWQRTYQQFSALLIRESCANLPLPLNVKKLKIFQL